MLKAAAVLIETEIENLTHSCTCSESACPCPACTEAERLDHLCRELSGEAGSCKGKCGIEPGPKTCQGHQ